MNDFPTQKSIAGASYISSLLSAFGGAMTLNEIAILVGIVFAFLTFVINWLYQAASNSRKARLSAMEEQHNQEIHVLQKQLLEAQLEKVRDNGHVRIP